MHHISFRCYEDAAWMFEMENSRDREYFVPVKLTGLTRRECTARMKPVVITDLVHPYHEHDDDNNKEKYVIVPTVAGQHLICERSGRIGSDRLGW